MAQTYMKSRRPPQNTAILWRRSFHHISFHWPAR